MNDFINVIGISLNSKNEKIIRGAFLLIRNILEINEVSLNNEYVIKFLNLCLNALKDEDLWQGNKIDAVETLGAISMYCPLVFIQ